MCSAEEISVLNAAVMAINFRQVYQNLTSTHLTVTIAVGSKGMHQSMATHSQPRYRVVTAEVYRLRLQHIYGDIDRIFCIPGTENPADPLNKHLSGRTTRILELILSPGRLVHDIENLRGIGIACQEEM